MGKIQFTISSKTLNSRLKILSKIQNRREESFGAKYFLFEVLSGVLVVTAVSQRTTLTTSIDIQNSMEDCSFLVPSKWLIELCKNIPHQPITFSVDVSNYVVQVQYENGEFQLQGESVDGFENPIYTVENSVKCELESLSILKGINYTLSSTAVDELRPVMNGVYVGVSEGAVTMVGSDGHRLVRYTRSSAAPDTQGSFILTKEVSAILKAILPKDQSTVKLEFNAKDVTINFQDWIMTFKSIEGRFPNYNAVIPQRQPYRAIINRKNLIGAVKRVSATSLHSNKLVRLSFNTNKIVVSGKCLDHNLFAKESLLCSYTDIPFEIGLKHTFLLDLLNVNPSEEIIIEFSSPAKAITISPCELFENEDLVTLLMPMMLEDYSATHV